MPRSSGSSSSSSSRSSPSRSFFRSSSSSSSSSMRHSTSTVTPSFMSKDSSNRKQNSTVPVATPAPSTVATPAPSTVATPAPSTVPNSNVSVQIQQPSLGSVFTQGITNGFGWGIGTNLARNLFFGSAVSDKNCSTLNTSSSTTPSLSHSRSSNVSELPIQNTEPINKTKCYTEHQELDKCTKQFGEINCLEKKELLKMCSERV
jgi:hypothetical protein